MSQGPVVMVEFLCFSLFLSGKSQDYLKLGNDSWRLHPICLCTDSL